MKRFFSIFAIAMIAVLTFGTKAKSFVYDDVYYKPDCPKESRYSGNIGFNMGSFLASDGDYLVTTITTEHGALIKPIGSNVSTFFGIGVGLDVLHSTYWDETNLGIPVYLTDKVFFNSNGLVQPYIKVGAGWEGIFGGGECSSHLIAIGELGCSFPINKFALEVGVGYTGYVYGNDILNKLGGTLRFVF